MKSNVSTMNKEDYYLVFSPNKLVLDYDLIFKMRRYGYTYEYVIKCLKDREVNYCTATYYLLLKDKI